MLCVVLHLITCSECWVTFVLGFIIISYLMLYRKCRGRQSDQEKKIRRFWDVEWVSHALLCTSLNRCHFSPHPHPLWLSWRPLFASTLSILAQIRHVGIGGFLGGQISNIKIAVTSSPSYDCCDILGTRWPNFCKIVMLHLGCKNCNTQHDT